MRAVLGTIATAVALMVGMASSAHAAPTHYIPMQDGVRLAAHLTLPEDYNGERLPTIFVYDGYAGGSSSYTRRDGWAVIKVSIRGTGCSGGQFDLFDRRHAKDGYEVVEWIADQPWSNGDVGIMGHSYGGISAVFVAAEDPPHLKALVASGLIDDLYRGITYIGGVPNLGFPALWTGAYRPAVDVAAGTGPGLRDGDQECEKNLADREAPNPVSDPFVNGLVGYTDGPWWAVHSLYTYLKGIDVPTFIGHAWQDEQTGPRGGPLVWEKLQLPAGVPKRLVSSNGDHGINGGGVPEVRAQRYAWLDRFVRGIENGIDTKPPVQILLETTRRGGAPSANGIIEGDDFPLPGTTWKRHYLREDGRLSAEAPPADGGSSSYVSGTSRQSWVFQSPTTGGEVTHASGPDELTFRSAPVEGEPTTIAGPIAATLYASTTAVGANAPTHTINTDFFVTVADEAPDGSLTYLQRGQLRASFRALDDLRTKRNADGEIIRPEHPFTHPAGVTPEEVNRYDIEVFPVAHVFRPGHRMVVKIYSPPLWESLYAPTPTRLPSRNTILHDAKRQSSLLVPVVATPQLGEAPACGEQIAMRCVKPLR